ncbi:MAG: hypothetical protein LBM93_11105 [Oscillospiraceae bacterium]|jgi:hypothetical protein|nr:hypothetical protein [Oscillospiraceae bacterium]
MTIKFRKPFSVERAIQTAKNAATQNNVSFSGDTKSGQARGLGFAGRYEVVADGILVTISEKPWYVSKDLLSNKLSEFWGNYLENERRTA